MKKIFILFLIISLFFGFALFISNCGVTSSGGGSVPSPWIYCGNRADTTILVIDGSTNTSVETIDIAPCQPEHMAASPDGKKIYVDILSSNAVVIIDTTTNTSVGAFSVPLSSSSLGMAVSHDGKYLYMTDSGSANLYRIYLTAGNTNEPISLSGNGWRMALNPDSTKAYVCGDTFSGVDIVDLQTDTVIDTISFTNDSWDVAVKGNYAYATIRHTDASSPDVVAIDMDTDLVAHELFSPGETITGIVSIPNKNKLYVSNNDDPGKLFIIDSTVPTIESTVITGEGASFYCPALMAATENYAYVYDAELHEKIGVINTNLDEIEKYIYGIDSSGVYNNPVIVYK